MTGILGYECPHCGSERASFDIVAISPVTEVPGPDDRSAFAHLRCRRCWRPTSAALVRDLDGVDFATLQTVVSPALNGWQIARMWPEPPKPDVPDHLPDSVREMLDEAERAFRQEDNMERTSALGFAKTLELAIKSFPEAQGHRLIDQIADLKTSRRITTELADWAQTLRPVRNDIMHGMEPFERADLEQFRSAVQMILRYLFTLPGMLAEIKAKRA